MDDGIDAGLFKFVGRDVLRAFRYNPQALHIVDPAGERRQSGVWLVPQLLVLHIRMLFVFPLSPVRPKRFLPDLTCKSGPKPAAP